MALLSWEGAAHGLGVPAPLFALYALASLLAIALGVVLGYHRVLTHRAAALQPWLLRTLVLLGAPAGTPLQWVGNHRFHHAHADSPEDPHSPAHRGLWVAHAGWYLSSENRLVCALYTFAGPLRALFDMVWRPRTNQEHAALAPDVAAVPFLAWMSRPGPYALVLAGHVLLSWGLVFLLFGLSLLPALFALQVLLYATGDLVNSAGHALGRRPFRSGCASRNSRWLGWLALGDGYHNGHHAFPASIRSGFLPGEVDLAYLFCRLFERLGWAHDLRVPSEAELLARAEPWARERMGVSAGKVAA